MVAHFVSYIDFSWESFLSLKSECLYEDANKRSIYRGKKRIKSLWIKLYQSIADFLHL